MRPIALVWLIYAQLALAAGPSHVYELLYLWCIYLLDHEANPKTAGFLLPTSTVFGKFPKNVGSNNGVLIFREFISRCFNDRRRVPAGLEFDFNNPLATADKLQKAGFGGNLRIPHLKGVPPSMFNNKDAMSELGDEWKRYDALIRGTKTIVQQARNTLGVGTIAKELAALRTLNQEVVRLRNTDMQQTRFFANELNEIWLKKDGNVYYRPFYGRDGKIRLDKTGEIISELRLDFMMDDAHNGFKIREVLGMSDQDQHDPRWKAAFKEWCSYIGDEEALEKSGIPGPKTFTDDSNKHRDIEKTWSSLMEDLRCHK